MILRVPKVADDEDVVDSSDNLKSRKLAPGTRTRCMEANIFVTNSDTLCTGSTLYADLIIAPARQMKSGLYNSDGYTAPLSI